MCAQASGFHHKSSNMKTIERSFLLVVGRLIHISEPVCSEFEKPNQVFSLKLHYVGFSLVQPPEFPSHTPPFPSVY